MLRERERGGGEKRKKQNFFSITKTFARREVSWLSAERESKHADIVGAGEMECGHHMAGIFAQPPTRCRHRRRRRRDSCRGSDSFALSTLGCE